MNLRTIVVHDKSVEYKPVKDIDFTPGKENSMRC